jgi:hypothetical protein
MRRFGTCIGPAVRTAANSAFNKSCLESALKARSPAPRMCSHLQCANLRRSIPFQEIVVGALVLCAGSSPMHSPFAGYYVNEGRAADEGGLPPLAQIGGASLLLRQPSPLARHLYQGIAGRARWDHVRELQTLPRKLPILVCPTGHAAVRSYPETNVSGLRIVPSPAISFRSERMSHPLMVRFRPLQGLRGWAFHQLPQLSRPTHSWKADPPA